MERYQLGFCEKSGEMLEQVLGDKPRPLCGIGLCLESGCEEVLLGMRVHSMDGFGFSWIED